MHLINRRPNDLIPRLTSNRRSMELNLMTFHLQAVAVALEVVGWNKNFHSSYVVVSSSFSITISVVAAVVDTTIINNRVVIVRGGRNKRDVRVNVEIHFSRVSVPPCPCPWDLDSVQALGFFF